MTRLLFPMSMISLISTGAIFGFFYAWVCSTMWGLDATSPTVAITAMNAMNASVRNAVFFPAFFLTPFFLAGTAILASAQGRQHAALLFGAAAALYFVGAMAVTITVNMPLNQALAQVIVPDNIEAARKIWQEYSSSWQLWNGVRTVASGLCLALSGLALYALKRDTA